jgi:hypothetical protein
MVGTNSARGWVLLSTLLRKLILPGNSVPHDNIVLLYQVEESYQLLPSLEYEKISSSTGEGGEPANHKLPRRTKITHPFNHSTIAAIIHPLYLPTNLPAGVHL